MSRAIAVPPTLDSIDQIARFVRAMKSLGHPGTDWKSLADLNEAVGHSLVDTSDELFDSFFTAKDVGGGTGQGPAMVRNLVTDRHAGMIDFTTDVGVGTTFTVRLPVDSGDQSSLSGPLPVSPETPA